ncbi:MAG: GTPase RsgA [Planctomycetes bacterium]|nr:GTPase RsgA [Planctomycetota bacterium]
MAKKRRGGKTNGAKRKIRVDFRKNQQNAAREKSQWTKLHGNAEHASADTQNVENVRAKGEFSRKRTIVTSEVESAKLLRGIVISMRGLIVEVDDGSRIWACTVRQVLRKVLIEGRHPVTVGDRVGFLPVLAGGEQSMIVSEERSLPEGVIDEVEPRRSTLVRHYERRLQAIAANVDLVVIVVAAANPTLRVHLIDRYIVAVHQGDMRPIICINKADLDETGEAVEAVERYRAIGYTAVLTSAKANQGIDEPAKCCEIN